MQAGRRIRLYPTKRQAMQLSRFAGAARFAWNESLAYCENVYRETQRHPSQLECRHHLVALRETTHPWLSEIPECVTKQAVKDLDKAYRTAFDNYRKDRVVSKKTDKHGNIINPYGFPVHKKKGKATPSFYQRTDAFRVIDKHHIKLTGIPTPIRVKYTRIPDKVCNPRVTRENGRWYLSYTYEKPAPDLAGMPETMPLGVDVGLKTMGVVSDGRIFGNPNHDPQAVRLENRIRYLQRRLSRKYEANKQGDKYVKTRNIIKLERKISRLQGKLADYRQTCRHEMTSNIVKSRPKTLTLETLNVRGMMSNKKMAKAVGKVGFAEIRRQFDYKCREYDVTLVEADQYYPSTQICSNCGAKTGPKGYDGLKVREWTCPNCGARHDRDGNAATNLAAYPTRGSSGSVCRSISPSAESHTNESSFGQIGGEEAGIRTTARSVRRTVHNKQ